MSSNDQVLNNKIIMVTGAAQGIGKAVSLALAKQGACVILLDKKTTQLEKIYDQIEASGGAQPAIYPMDLASATSKDFDDVYDNLNEEFSHLDGLIHNAAMLGSLMPIMQFDLEHWSKIMQVNLNAPYLLTRACLPLLNKSASGRLLFTSDDVGAHGKAYWGAYAMSKAASDNLMQTLADELEINTSIRVNSIDPGIVATDLRAAAYPGEDPKALTQADDITEKYIYLMSDESAHINGETIYCQN